MGRGQPLVLAGLLVVVSLFAPASLGHTQQTLTVILTDEGVVAGNITDPAFVQGNIAWFRMEDSTNNTSMVVRVDVDMDGVFNASNDFESPTLTNTCELDENGSLVDETCAVSSKYAFDMNASVGTYQFWVHRTHNGTETVWNHSIMVHKDVHEEDGPSPGDCFGIGCETDEGQAGSATGDISSTTDRSMVIVLGVVSLIGMLALTMSIRQERMEAETHTEKSYLEAE
ncbi:MAG: hypothetical protein VX831_01425 [Candidatus Thermoplasmatota archaeon]|nr:hypothetical protein [Candidatus Thermoplasmatota archaeon]